MRFGRPQWGMIEFLGFQAGANVGGQMLDSVNSPIGPFGIDLVITDNSDYWPLWFDSTNSQHWSFSIIRIPE
jgi:hypothetical protein